jgi:uncharacterized protein (TIGR03083 family)
MSPDRYLDELAASLTRLSALARGPGNVLARPVPACPGWTLDDLFGHLGSIERWAADVVLSGTPCDQPAPPSGEASAWFLAGTRAFVDAMAGLDPEAPCWGFGPPPRTAGFWLRRQAHEHAVHLVDACQALGLETPEFGEDFMLDGIGEVLAMFVPRQLRLKRMDAPTSAVSFHAPGGGAWTLGEGPAAASVTAPLRGLYLGLWGRSDLSRTAVIDGDAALALRVLRGPLTP